MSLQGGNEQLLVGADAAKPFTEIWTWSYDFPTRQLGPHAGLIAFYNEKVDVIVDGEPPLSPMAEESADFSYVIERPRLRALVKTANKWSLLGSLG